MKLSILEVRYHHMTHFAIMMMLLLVMILYRFLFEEFLVEGA